MDILARNESAETAIEQITNVVDLQQTHPDQKVLHGVQTNLFDLGEIDVTYDEERKTLWAFMTPQGLPNLNIHLIKDIVTIQTEIPNVYSSNADNLKYLVFGSRFPGIFNLGGDLDLFSNMIENKDRLGLKKFAQNCVSIFYQTHTNFNLPLISIALIQGETLGGGFEAALSFDVIIAEKDSKFGLPETSFGLFPAVGAHVQLVRSLGAAQAERIIMSGRSYTAEELYELGIVHVLAEPGKGEEAVNHYIAQNTRRHSGLVATYKATRAVRPITKEELERIAEIWVDAALQVSPQNLKLMRRIAGAQAKLVSNHVKVAC